MGLGANMDKRLASTITTTTTTSCLPSACRLRLRAMPAISRKEDSTMTRTSTDLSRHLDPRSPTPRVLPDLQAQEDRPARIRWLEVRQLRARPHCPRIPDRGAEDRQEGAQGAGCWQQEEELKDDYCCYYCWAFKS